MTIEGFAPAKVNLTLHITGQRDDGYHLLDSLVIFADVGDQLRLSEAPEMSLKVTGPYAGGVPIDQTNLVWRAAELCGMSAEIVLEKNLPNAAGIGGGSADAAAVLRAALQLGYNLPDDVTTLGADVPVCIRSRPQRMQGIGDVIASVGELPETWIVLANPKVDVPTPSVFSELKTKSNRPMADIMPTWKSYDDFCEWLNAQRNDLEEPAQKIQPVISDVLGTLRDATVTRMSGSGATCFGIYPSAVASKAAAERIQRNNPDWWVADAKVLGA